MVVTGRVGQKDLLTPLFVINRYIVSTGVRTVPELQVEERTKF